MHAYAVANKGRYGATQTEWLACVRVDRVFPLMREGESGGDGDIQPRLFNRRRPPAPATLSRKNIVLVNGSFRFRCAKH